MAVPYTLSSDVGNILAAAYDRKVEFALRALPRFRSLVDKRPAQQTAPGTTVNFQIYSDLATSTTPLSEDTDPAGKTLANPTRVTVTLEEYGDYTVIPQKLTELTFANGLLPDVVDIITEQQYKTVDKLVQNAMAASTNVITEEAGALVKPGGAGQNVNDITGTDTFKSKHIRYALAKLRGASVMGQRGSLYGAMIHPDVAHDVRTESGSLGWRVPREYSDPSDIWAGETGTYEGVFFVENPLCASATNTGTVKVFNTYIMGKQAVAEVVANEFHTVIGGTVSDPLDRKTAIGWRGVAGWSIYRPESLFVVKTASSIA